MLLEKLTSGLLIDLRQVHGINKTKNALEGCEDILLYLEMLTFSSYH